MITLRLSQRFTFCHLVESSCADSFVLYVLGSWERSFCLHQIHLGENPHILLWITVILNFLPENSPYKKLLTVCSVDFLKERGTGKRCCRSISKCHFSALWILQIKFHSPPLFWASWLKSHRYLRTWTNLYNWMLLKVSEKILINHLTRCIHVQTQHMMHRPRLFSSSSWTDTLRETAVKQRITFWASQSSWNDRGLKELHDEIISSNLRVELEVSVSAARETSILYQWNSTCFWLKRPLNNFHRNKQDF